MASKIFLGSSITASAKYNLGWGKPPIFSLVNVGWEEHSSANTTWLSLTVAFLFPSQFKTLFFESTNLFSLGSTT